MNSAIFLWQWREEDGNKTLLNWLIIWAVFLPLRMFPVSPETQKTHTHTHTVKKVGKVMREINKEMIWYKKWNVFFFWFKRDDNSKKILCNESMVSILACWSLCKYLMSDRKIYHLIISTPKYHRINWLSQQPARYFIV